MHIAAALADYALPSVGGFTPTVHLPLGSIPVGQYVPVTTSLDPATSAFDVAALRSPLFSAPSPLFYTTIDPSSDLTLSQFPGVSVALPPGLDTTGRAFYLAASDPSAGPSAPYARILGPATVGNGTLTFPSTNPSITFAAGKSYTFAVFSATTAVATSKVYVRTISGNSIVARPVGGGPVLTIAGPATGLNNPVSLDEDAAGTLFVLNRPAASGAAGTITEYQAGANGNVAPTTTLTAPALDAATQLRVVPSTGEIYFAAVTPFPANGSVIGSVNLIAAGAKGAVATQTIETPNVPRDLTVGADGRLYSYEIFPRGGLGGGIRVYDPALLGSIGTTSGGPWYIPDAQGIAASQARSEICALDDGTITCFSESDLSGRGTITRTIAGAATQLSLQSAHLFFAADESLIVISNAGTALRFAPGANGNVAPVPANGSPYGVYGP